MKIVKHLANCWGVKVNIRNNQGKTPLHLAAKQGHIEVVQALIALKAKVNVLKLRNNKPLCI